MQAIERRALTQQSAELADGISLGY